MFNFHKRENLFQTRVIVEKKEELPPELKEPDHCPKQEKKPKSRTNTDICPERGSR